MKFNSSIQHFSFDKDGIIIDVHQYWNYNCRLRAKNLINRLKLHSIGENDLLLIMGIDPKSNKIKSGGPVGYHPRDIVIDNIVEFLLHLNVDVRFSDISDIFLEIDALQQSKDDYNILLLKGVDSFLQWLKEKKLLISLYTSDRRLNAEKILDKVGLINLFDTVVGGDDVNKGKPDPEGFIAACNNVHVKPHHSAYVGDTVSDMVMANKGDAAIAFGLETGLFKSSELLKETDFTYPSMIELHAEIEKYL